MRTEELERIQIRWTPRQKEVLNLLAQGHTNPEIAQRLGISLDGAKWHVSEVMSTLGVRSREAAAAYWRREQRPSARFARALRGLAFGPVLRWSPAAIGAITVVCVFTVLLLVTRGGDESGQALPEITETPAATTPTPDQSSAVPSPSVTLNAQSLDTGCPVEDAELCSTAFDFLSLAKAHDSDKMLARSRPRTVACPAPGQPVSILVADPGDVCRAASEGELRPYYLASDDSGEGRAETPELFAPSLQTYLERLPQGPALEWDTYGSGNLVIAGVACFRTSGQPGTCTGEFAYVVLTALRNEQRIVACLGFRRAAADSSSWHFDSFGCGNPVNFLYSFTTPAIADESTRGTLQNYPWTPAARRPLPPAALAALAANLPVRAALDGECQVTPQSPSPALCYTNLEPVPGGFQVNIGYRGTSGGWKAVLLVAPDGTYRVDSITEQKI